MKEISIPRKELYEEVWSAPMIKLAKKYKLTGNGLKKVCLKHNIPVPCPGYWQRLEHKKNPFKTALPHPDDNHLISISVSNKENQPSDTHPGLLKFIEFENQDINHVIVPATLQSPHNIVRKTLTALKQSLKEIEKNKGQSYYIPNDYGMVITSGSDNGAARCRIGPDSFDRATRILDTLFKALEKRGVQITTESKTGNFQTNVILLEEKIPIMVDERAQRIEHIKTEEEIKRNKKYETNGFYYDLAPKYDYKPSGEIKLKIETWLENKDTVCKDTKRKVLEDQLNDFIILLYKHAFAIKRRRKEREIQEQKWQERRIALELERQRRVEE